MDNFNNSDEMKTVVETYIMEETQALIYDDAKLDEWNKYVNDLGLTGQHSIVKPTKSPMPFIHVTPVLKNIFNTLCPVAVSIEKYNVAPIPLEILSLVSLAKREHYFEEIQIWYDDKATDPVCVGINYENYYAQNDEGSLKGSFPTKAEAQAKMDANGWTKHKPYPTNKVFYLMGRWGDVKRSFADLATLAHAKYLASKGSELTLKIRELKRKLDDLEENAKEMYFGNGKEVDLPF